MGLVGVIIRYIRCPECVQPFLARGLPSPSSAHAQRSKGECCHSDAYDKREHETDGLRRALTSANEGAEMSHERPATLRASEQWRVRRVLGAMAMTSM